MTHYDALEVARDASPEVIRAAYKSLMQRFHPDKHPGDDSAGARATAIAQAYAVLSDVAGRAAYDASLRRPDPWPAPPVREAQPARRGDAERPLAGAWPASRVALWVLLVCLTLTGIWTFAPRRAGSVDPRAELVSIERAFASRSATEARRRELYARKLALLQEHPELVPPARAAQADDVAARTFELLEAPLVLQVGAATGPFAQLTIPAMSLVVGSFDAPVLLAHLAKHREQLLLDISERIARRDAARFASADGERFLRQAVLEAAAASLGNKPSQEYPSTYFESPGRHGVVDVLLPDRYTLVN